MRGFYFKRLLDNFYSMVVIDSKYCDYIVLINYCRFSLLNNTRSTLVSPFYEPDFPIMEAQFLTSPELTRWAVSRFIAIFVSLRFTERAGRLDMSSCWGRKSKV